LPNFEYIIGKNFSFELRMKVQRLHMLNQTCMLM